MKRATTSARVAPEDRLPVIDMEFTEILHETARASGFAQKDCEEIGRKLIAVITDHLCNGRQVRLPPLGQIIIKTVERQGATGPKLEGKLVLVPNTDTYRQVAGLLRKPKEP